MQNIDDMDKVECIMRLLEFASVNNIPIETMYGFLEYETSRSANQNGVIERFQSFLKKLTIRPPKKTRRT